MPLIWAIIAASSTGALVYDRIVDDTNDVVENTGTNLIVLGAAALGLYGAYVAISNAKA